jgi:hypothetical protein
MANDANREQAAHPLVGLLFWVLGKDLHDQPSRESMDEHSLGSPAIDTPDTLGSGRALSWKDDNPDEKLVTWHEFADVKAPDVPLAEGANAPRLSSSMKPGGGTTLARKMAGVEGERSFSEDDPNRRSPNSDQWGLFVSLTPPMEYYSAAAEKEVAEAKR